MAPSANGQKAAVQQRVYIVVRRAEFRELNSHINPNTDDQPYEPEISYLDFAYVDEKQAYAVAIREQILELDENGTHNGRNVAAQTSLSLKERLKNIHKVVDVAAEAHEDPEAPVVKFEVLEFPLAPVQPFQESVFLKDLDNPDESEDVEDDEEEEEGDEEEGDEEEVEEEVDEGEEGVEEVEGEEEEDDEEGEDDVIELDDDDEGEEVDDDDDDEDEEDDEGAPKIKKQRT